MNRYEAEAIWAWITDTNGAALHEVWRLNHLPRRLNDEWGRAVAAAFLRALADALTTPDTSEE